PSISGGTFPCQARFTVALVGQQAVGQGDDDFSGGDIRPHNCLVGHRNEHLAIARAVDHVDIVRASLEHVGDAAKHVAFFELHGQDVESVEVNIILVQWDGMLHVDHHKHGSQRVGLVAVAKASQLEQPVGRVHPHVLDRVYGRVVNDHAAAEVYL